MWPGGHYEEWLFLWVRQSHCRVSSGGGIRPLAAVWEQMRGKADAEGGQGLVSAFSIIVTAITGPFSLTTPTLALVTGHRGVSGSLTLSLIWVCLRACLPDPCPCSTEWRLLGALQALLSPISLSTSQKSFYNLMTSDKKSERFFKVLHDRMKRAQQETKSTVAVNMSDLGSQPREDREPEDPTAKGQGWGQGHRGTWWGVLSGVGGYKVRVSQGRDEGFGCVGGGSVWEHRVRVRVWPLQ